MKKLLMLFSIVLIGITLSGCSLIPEDIDIDQISEDFCRDNPTSEICEGDLIENLGDQAILDLFNTVVTDYNDDTNTTFCDDYFSVTNIELLDGCRTTKEDLLPLNFENFTVLGAEKMPTVSTQNIYEIKTVSDDGLTEVVFTVGVVNVDESMYVSTWSYEIIEVDPTTLTVPIEEAQAYFEQFLLDYANIEISDEAFCNMYFPDDENCVEGRENVFIENLSFILNSISDLGDGVYNLEVAVGTDSALPEVDFLDISFRYDSLGNIIMEFDDGTTVTEDIIEFEEAEEFIFSLIADFNNVDLPSNEVCGIYFEGYEIDECMLHRAEMQGQGAIIELVDFYEDEKGYVIYLEYTVDSEIIDEEMINVFFYYDQYQELKVSFMDNNNDNNMVSMEIAYDELVFLLEVFTDSSVSSEEFCQIFFPELDNTNCFLDRESIIMYNLYFEIVEIIDYDGYFEAVITIEIPELGTAYEYQIGMHFYYDMYHNLYMDVWELGGYAEYLAYEDAVIVFQELIDALNDPTISWEYIIDIYFGNMQDDGQAEQRLIDLENGYYVSFISATQHDTYPESYFEVVIEEFDGEEFSTQNIWVRIQIFEDGSYLFEFEDSYIEPEYTYDDAYNLLQFFYEEYYWDYLPSDEFCVIFFEGIELDECIEYRDDPERDLGMANFIGLYQSYDGWIIELEVEFLSGAVEFYIIDLDFYLDENGDLKMTFKDINIIIIDQEEAFILINQFFVGMYDESISDEEYCLQFGYYIYDCLTERPLINDEPVVWIVDFWHVELNRYALIIAGDDLYDEVIQHLEFYYDADGVLRFEFMDIYIPDPEPDYFFVDYETSQEFFILYLEDYFNADLSNQDLADMYFFYYLDPMFAVQRDIDLANTLNYYIVYITDPLLGNGMEFFEASLVMNTIDGSVPVIINFRFIGLDVDLLVLEFDYSTYFENPIVEDLTIAIEAYLVDFNDTSLPSTEFCTMYYEGPLADECILFREGMLLDKLSLEFYSMFQKDDGIFMLDVDVNFAGEFIYNIVFDVVVFPTVDGYDFEILLFADPIIPDDPILVDVEAMILDYVLNYTDVDILGEDFCANYTDYPVDCEFLRSEMLTRGAIHATLNDLYISYDPEFLSELILILGFEFSDGTYEEHMYVVVPYHSYIDETLRFDLILIDWYSPMPIELFPITEVEAIYNIFVEEYNNLTKTDDYICTAYSFLLDSELYCYEGRMDSLTAGFYLVVDTIELLNDPIYGNYYSIIIAETDGSSSFFLTYDLYVYINEYGDLVFEHVWDTYPE